MDSPIDDLSSPELQVLSSPSNLDGGIGGEDAAAEVRMREEEGKSGEAVAVGHQHCVDRAHGDAVVLKVDKIHVNG